MSLKQTEMIPKKDVLPLRQITDAKRIVVKVGTSTLAHQTGMLNIRRIENLVKTLADLQNDGKELILVSSGAIGVGSGKLGLNERPADTPTKQACASIGQCELMYVYDKLFSEYNHCVSQILMTRDIIDSPKRVQNVTNTFEKLLSLRVIPIVNENDSVSVEEIEFGDNDTLSALVANLANADALIILTDIDGLYEDDPKKNPDAKLIPTVKKIDSRIESLAQGKGSTLGTGGMITKIHAARIATEAGIPVYICNGADPNILYDLCDGKQVGTVFLA